MKLELDRKQVLNCRFSAWYSTFRANKCTIRSKIINLPKEFIDYLNVDGIVLPIPPNDTTLHYDDPRVDGNNDEDSDDEELENRVQIVSEGQESDSESENDQRTEFTFPKLEEQFSEAIEALGGYVFPKFDWTAPADAEWMKGTMKCQNPGDIFLLLKGSDFIQHDLNHAFEYCTDAAGLSDENQLVLRKWSNLYASMEFRCIVHENKLVAICQRNCRSVYPHLKDLFRKFVENETGNIVDIVLEFYEDKVARNFPENTYTFDIYVDKNNRVWLIDFGVLAKFSTSESVDETKSNGLLATPPHHLLSWEDLKAIVDNDYESIPNFHVIHSEKETIGNVMGMHKVPMELVHGELSSEFVAESLAKFEKMAMEQQN